MDEEKNNDIISASEDQNNEDSKTEILTESEQVDTTANSTDGGNKNKKTIIIACIAVAVVAIIVAVILIVRGTSGKKNEDTSSDNSIDIMNDLTNESGSLLSDEEINSRIAEERDPELLSIIAEATTKFSPEVGTGSSNQIVPATKAPTTTTAANGSGAAATTATSNSNQGAASATTAPNNSNQNTTPTTAASNNNNETTQAPADNNTADKEQADKAIEQIKAFYDRRCYFEGTMYENGEGNPMSIAFNGEDYEVYTQLDNIEISIMKKDGKFYMKRPAAKQYVELNDSLLTMIGLNMDDINVSFGSKDFSSLTATSVYDVTINGQAGVCYQYKSEDGYSEFYAVDGQLKEIDIKDNNLITQTQLQVSQFSTSIPSDQLNLNGYSQAKSIFTMLSDVT